MDPNLSRIPLEVNHAAPPPPAPTTPPSPPSVATSPASQTVEEQVQAAAQEQDLRERIIAALKTCYDPEVPVNIYEMGLIYNLDISESGQVHVKMTLTSPACPVAGSLPPEVKAKVESIPGVTGAKVDVVWDPPWTPSLMSEAAKLELGIFDY